MKKVMDWWKIIVGGTALTGIAALVLSGRDDEKNDAVTVIVKITNDMKKKIMVTRDTSNPEEIHYRISEGDA